jgi:hypothetical protein
VTLRAVLLLVGGFFLLRPTVAVGQGSIKDRLTLSGTPQAGRSVRDLAQMARGAISLVKNQLDDDAVEYRALADLASVGANPDKLEINLALPAQDLFDKLHFPCPGRDGGM